MEILKVMKCYYATGITTHMAVVKMLGGADYAPPGRNGVKRLIKFI